MDNFNKHWNETQKRGNFIFTLVKFMFLLTLLVFIGSVGVAVFLALNPEYIGGFFAKIIEGFSNP